MGKSNRSTVRIPGRPSDLGPGEARGTPGVGVKSCNPGRTTSGEGVALERIRPATDVLDSIIMSTTRAAGITAAAGTRLTRPLLLVLFRNENSGHKVSALGVPPSWFPTLRSFRDCCAP